MTLQQYTLAGIGFFAASATRGNGILSVFYILFFGLHDVRRAVSWTVVSCRVSVKFLHGDSFICKQKDPLIAVMRATWICVRTLAISCAACAPYVLFQLYAYRVHCTGVTGGEEKHEWCYWELSTVTMDAARASISRDIHPIRSQVSTCLFIRAGQVLECRVLEQLHMATVAKLFACGTCAGTRRCCVDIVRTASPSSVLLPRALVICHAASSQQCCSKWLLACVTSSVDTADAGDGVFHASQCSFR